MPPAFDRWVRQWRIETEVVPNLYTVTTWTKHCSPEGASSEQRAVACMDLAISFFYLDDYAGSDYHAVFDAFEANHRGAPRENALPAAVAHADLLAQLRGLGRSLTWYTELELALLGEYRLRNDAARGLVPLTFDRYRACRLVTIYVYQWLELWQLIGDFQIGAAERESAAFRDGVRLASTFYYLGNELYSLERDQQRGELNLVPLLAAQEGIDLAAAVERLEVQRSDAGQAFAEVLPAMLAGSAELRRCGELLDRCVRVAEAARADNPLRYHRAQGSSSNVGRGHT